MLDDLYLLFCSQKATQTVNEGEGAVQIQANNIAGVEQEQNEEVLGVELDGAVIVEPNMQAAEEVGVDRVEVENHGGNADYEQPQDWNPQNEVRIICWKTN